MSVNSMLFENFVKNNLFEVNLGQDALYCYWFNTEQNEMDLSKWIGGFWEAVG